MENKIENFVTSQEKVLVPLEDHHFALKRNSEVDYILEMLIKESCRMVKAGIGNYYYFSSDMGLEAFNTKYDSEQFRLISRYCIDKRTFVNINVNDPDSIPEELRSELKKEPLKKSCVCAYLGIQDDRFAAILLSDPIYYKYFFENDFSILKSFASTFSILLKNARNSEVDGDMNLSFRSSLLLLLDNAHLIQKSKESNLQLKSVLEVSNLINSSRELKELVEAVFYSARKVFRAESASLFLVDEKTGDLYFDIISEDSQSGLEGVRIPQGQGIVGLVAKEQRSIIVNDAQNDPRIFRAADKIAKNTTRNLLASPLIVDGKTLGVIEIINTIDRSFFTEQDLEIFESFSDSVAIAIQRRTLLDNLQVANVQLERKLKETTCLHSVAKALVESSDKETLFREVLNIIIRDLNIDRTLLFLADKFDSLDCFLNVGKPLDDIVIEDLLTSARQLYINSIIDDKIQQSENFVYDQMKMSSSNEWCLFILLGFPHEKKPYGILSLSGRNVVKFTEDDRRLINTICSQLTRGYDNFLLSEQLLIKRAMEKEVEITSKIQRDILPKKIPLHLHLDCAGESIMAKTTGGDFYDYYLEETNGAISMLVADVSGKSLPAALFMAVSSSILRTIIRHEKDPVKVLSRANELLYEESQSGMFVTVFLTNYDPKFGKMKYASAGHNEMLLLHGDGSYDLLSGKGTPLGTLPAHKVTYLGGEVVIKQDDILVLYTDGVVEAVDKNNEEFGLERFLGILKKNKSKSPQEIIDTVYSDVSKFAGYNLQYDDFTMFVSRFKGISQEDINYNIDVPINIQSIPSLRDEIKKLLFKHGISGHLLEDTLLAIDEAVTNIILHGISKKNDPNLFIKLDLKIIAGEKIIVTLTDNAGEFALEKVKAPDPKENLSGRRKGGFGVYLIKSLMDDMKYFRKNDYNILQLEKNIK